MIISFFVFIKVNPYHCVWYRILEIITERVGWVASLQEKLLTTGFPEQLPCTPAGWFFLLEAKGILWKENSTAFSLSPPTLFKPRDLCQYLALPEWSICRFQSCQAKNSEVCAYRFAHKSVIRIIRSYVYVWKIYHKDIWALWITAISLTSAIRSQRCWPPLY